MKSINTLALVSLLIAAPSLALAQKPGKPGRPPAAVKVHTAVRHDVVRNDAAGDAAKSARNANRAAEKGTDKVADKAEKTGEKTEHLALNSQRNDKRLLSGIKLTSAEKAQIEATKKRYDDQIRALRQTENAGDRTAKKNGTPDNDAAFLASLASLNTQERADLRTALTVSQQAQFDANVVKFAPKH